MNPGVPSSARPTRHRASGRSRSWLGFVEHLRSPSRLFQQRHNLLHFVRVVKLSAVGAQALLPGDAEEVSVIVGQFAAHPVEFGLLRFAGDSDCYPISKGPASVCRGTERFRAIAKSQTGAPEHPHLGRLGLREANGSDNLTRLSRRAPDAQNSV